MDLDFTEDEIRRYSRHILLQDVGGIGQAKLKAARVLVIGAVTGVMGTLQATEALKEILGVGESLSGKLLLWDALATRFRTVRLRQDADCALCGPNATIKDLSQHRDAAAPICAV